MRYAKYVAFLTALLAVSCAPTDPFQTAESNAYTPSTNTSEIASFDLVTPTNGAVLSEIPTFSWEAADGASTYTLEISSSDEFISNIETIVYYSQPNLTATSFNIRSDLAKDTQYYWRVHAVNDAHELLSGSTFSFFLEAPDVQAVDFELGEADDWALHPDGSRADIAIDESNFFGNDEPALAITFKVEDTQRGDQYKKSNGWIVVTRTVEKYIYGTDSIYLNLYYAGHDAKIFIRLIDNDNEYWVHQVQISSNARQSVILPFAEFTQRDKDVTVANRVFDYFHIKYLEVVFEEVNGDGAALFSDFKAVRFSDYGEYFISLLHFDRFDDEDWTNEAYTFERTINDTELVLNYYGDDGVHEKIGGYGFAKLNVKRYFVQGSAIKVSVRLTGYKGSNVIIRIYEQDTDRWAYMMPMSSFVENEWKDFVIPYDAFALSQAMGSGRREFYNIINIQFGVNGTYGAGTVSFKDFEIVDMEDYRTEDARDVGPDGLIEDFSRYGDNAEIYFSWMHTNVNKDEAMSLNTSDRYNMATNPVVGQFEYKSDMAEAGYGIPIRASGDWTSVSLSFKDLSTLASQESLAYLGQVSARTNIHIYLTTGEHYIYFISALAKVWTEYTIPFADFTYLEGGKTTPRNPINATNIYLVGFAFSYLYYNKAGAHTPVYTAQNKVLCDDLRLSSETEFSTRERIRVVHMDGDLCHLEDFEGYASSEELFNNWSYRTEKAYNLMALSDDVSNIGGTHSLAAQFKENSDSISYQFSPSFDSDCRGKGLLVDIKGTGSGTTIVYLNIYVGSLQWRYTLSGPSGDWTHYVIGFKKFVGQGDAADRILLAKDVPNISRLTIGLVDWSGNYKLKNVLFDNFELDNSLASTDTYSAAPIA